MTQKLVDFFNEHMDKTIFSSLGMTLEKLDGDETIVSLEIDDRHKQHRGLVHGGVYVVLAESAASLAGASLVKYPDESVVGIEINANHLKATREGKITARSKRIHQGKNTLVYEVYVENENEKLISAARCTLMVIKNINKI